MTGGTLHPEHLLTPNALFFFFAPHVVPGVFWADSQEMTPILVLIGCLSVRRKYPVSQRGGERVEVPGLASKIITVSILASRPPISVLHPGCSPAVWRSVELSARWHLPHLLLSFYCIPHCIAIFSQCPHIFVFAVFVISKFVMIAFIYFLCLCLRSHVVLFVHLEVGASCSHLQLPEHRKHRVGTAVWGSSFTKTKRLLRDTVDPSKLHKQKWEMHE